MSDSLIPVPFRAETLYIVSHLDQPYVPMKPVAEALGLDWKSQHAKIKLAQRYGDIAIPLHSPGGIQETLCIPLRKLNGWLFSINPVKVAPQLRDTVIAYQEECFQALYEYWHTGVARHGCDDSERNELAGDAEPFAPVRCPYFTGLDSAVMRELRLLNPRLVQAYLVDHGITPSIVDSLLSGRPALPGPGDQANAAPIEVLASRIETACSHQDDEAWYLRRHEWMQLCQGYDPRLTALWLRDLGILRTNDGRLTLRGSPLMFDGERPTVFCIQKPLNAAPFGIAQHQPEGRRAHVQ